MLLSELGITHGFSEWMKNLPMLGKCYSNLQQQHSQRLRHYSYHHHHHRIAGEGGEGNGSKRSRHNGNDIPSSPTTTAIATTTTAAKRVHSSWPAVAVMALFIATMHCQVANGANSSDSYSSVYSSNVITSSAIGDDYDSARNFVHSPAPSRLRRSPIYHNEFAVYIPSGIDAANAIADQFGFTNEGQVSYCLFYYVYYYEYVQIKKKNVQIAQQDCYAIYDGN